jgi:ubiquinone/menaquinone biosynthesis C-methylase UbiE
MLQRPARLLIITVSLALLISCSASSQERHPETDRPLASMMGVLGAPWLDRPERMQEERPDLAVKLLALKPGMAVADIGAGTGYYTELLSKAVGADGKVYATDVQIGMLRYLEIRKKQKNLTNVEVVRGGMEVTGLRENSVDLALMVDVYHEFQKPVEMMADLMRALKPGGQVALVEYRKEDPNVPILEDHKMSEKQIKKELSAAGFRHVKTHHRLPWQHLVVFEKPPVERAAQSLSTVPRSPRDGIE